MDMRECVGKGFIKKTRPNNETARSLIEMSGIKFDVISSVELNESNIRHIFPWPMIPSER